MQGFIRIIKASMLKAQRNLRYRQRDRRPANRQMKAMRELGNQKNRAIKTKTIKFFPLVSYLINFY